MSAHDQVAGLDVDRLRRLAEKPNGVWPTTDVREARRQRVRRVDESLDPAGVLTDRAISLEQLVPVVELAMRHHCRSDLEQWALIQVARAFDRDPLTRSLGFDGWENEALDTWDQLRCTSCGNCFENGDACRDCIQIPTRLLAEEMS